MPLLYQYKWLNAKYHYEYLWSTEGVTLIFSNVSVGIQVNSVALTHSYISGTGVDIFKHLK